MSSTVSPAGFALRQLLSAWAPWITFGAIIAGIGVGIAHRVGGSPVLHLLGVALFFLCTGGIALGYAAAWMNMIYRGLVPTPRTPWRVELRGDAVHIASAKHVTDVPLAGLAAITLLDDDSWDRMNGMETFCLVLRRRRGARISIPGTSHGFSELLAALRRTTRVDVETL